MKTFTKISMFAAAAGMLTGCSMAHDDSIVSARTQQLDANAHYYLRCNATGWGVDSSSRLVPDSSGQLLTLTYDVAQPWMLQGDNCVITKTNQLNGWGTQPSDYGATSSPLLAPGSSSVASSSSFQIAYPALGTYTAHLDLSSDVLSVTAGTTVGPTTCVVDGSTTPPAIPTRENTDGYFVTPTEAATVLPWGSETTWSYTTNAPPSGWTAKTFDDSSWSTGGGGFYDGTRPGDSPTTPWPSGASDLWLRTTVDLTECDVEHLLFWARWDDTMEVYVNGVLANEQGGWTAGYHYLGLREGAKDALAVGTNTVAVHVHDTGGGKYFDLGLVRNEKMSSRIEDGYSTTSAVEQFSEATKNFMIEYGIPAGTLAVMKNDQIVLSKAYGYADKYFTEPLQEGAVLRLASNDKVITLATVQDLIDSGTYDPVTSQNLTRDTLVYPLLVAHGLTPPPGRTVAPTDGIHDVTVDMLLTHRSGLKELPDASVIAATFGISEDEITLEHNVRWLTSTPGDFTPGTEERYCSSCYMLARYLVEVLKGDLVTHIQNVTLAPAETAGVFLATERLEDRQPSEPWYATLEAPYSRWVNLEEYRALSATAPGLVRMLRRYHLGFGNKLIDPVTGQWAAVPDNGGGVFWGGMAGTSSLTFQRRWDEVNIAFVFNLPGDYDGLYQQLRILADGMSEADWGL